MNAHGNLEEHEKSERVSQSDNREMVAEIIAL